MEERQSLLQQFQRDVEEVRVIMHGNLIRAEERKETLDDLDQRADKLLKCSEKFAKTTRRPIENQQQRNGIRKGICCAVVLVIIIALSIIITGTRKHWFR